GQIALVALALASLIATRAVLAQSPPVIQFPSTPSPPASSVPANTIPSLNATPGAISQPTFGAGTPRSTAVSPYGSFPTGQAVPFDPYSSSGSAAYNFWGTTPSKTAGLFAQPPTSPYAATSPLAPPPSGTSQPASLFPNGVLSDPQWDLSKSIRFIQ